MKRTFFGPPSPQHTEFIRFLEDTPKQLSTWAVYEISWDSANDRLSSFGWLTWFLAVLGNSGFFCAIIFGIKWAHEQGLIEDPFLLGLYSYLVYLGPNVATITYTIIFSKAVFTAPAFHPLIHIWKSKTLSLGKKITGSAGYFTNVYARFALVPSIF